MNQCLTKTIDRWLVILKMRDISGSMIVDLKKIYHTETRLDFEYRTVKIHENTKKC
jgi:hypothetical protein